MPAERPRTGPGRGTPEEIGAAWNRFKRLTTGENVAHHMWEERQRLVADLPAPPGPDDHVPLVIYFYRDSYHGACGAERCYYLGPDRDNETATHADTVKHCAAMAKKALRAAKKKKALRAAKTKG